MDIPVAVDEEGKLWTKDKIDETLSIKGFSADAAAVGEALKNIKVDGFISYTEQTLTDEQKAQARANIGASEVIILPLPSSNTLGSNETSMMMEVDIEDLEASCIYGVPAISGITSYYLTFIVNCDDGTKKIVTSYIGNITGKLFKLTKANTIYTLHDITDSNKYAVNVTDKSTSTNVIVTYGYYLTTDSTINYTPTGDYNPATKKYVDDAVSQVAESVGEVSVLVGDASVSEQITTALNESAVLYSASQTLTNEQKRQAQDNIGFSETDAIELATNMRLVSPAAAEDGSIYTDENGVLYSL